MDAGFLVPHSPAARQRWFVAGLLLLFVATSIQYTHKVLAHENGSAIVRWRDQLLALDGGEDIYKHFTYPNPPIMALLLRPLAELRPLTGALVWFYLKVAFALISIRWAFRLVETPERPFPAWAKAVVVLLSLRPILGDLSHGNINLFILFLVMAALIAFQNRRDGWAGVILGLAIACKVTPALFVPYFLWKGSWRVLAGCAVGCVLGFLVLPALFFAILEPGLIHGFQKNWQLLESWIAQMVTPYVVSGEVYYSEHNNQSLPGLALRLLTESPSFTTFDGNQRVGLAYHNIAAFDPRWVVWIASKGCMLAFAALVMWSCRTSTSSRQGWRLPAECALVLLGMLLLSERTWKHHCVTLLLPFAVLVYHVAVCRPGKPLRTYLIGTLSAAAVLMMLTSTGSESEQTMQMSPGKLAQVYGAYVWAYILLGAALVVVLRAPADAEEPVREETPWPMFRWQPTRS